jgi:hypothetical protein
MTAYIASAPDLLRNATMEIEVPIKLAGLRRVRFGLWLIKIGCRVAGCGLVVKASGEPEPSIHPYSKTPAEYRAFCEGRAAASRHEPSIIPDEFCVSPMLANAWYAGWISGIEAEAGTAER